MSMFSALDISASALTAERERSEIAVANLANADTTRGANGSGPYRRREVVLESVSRSPFESVLNRASDLRSGSAAAGGVKLMRVIEDDAKPVRRYDPGHPDADTDGYVSYPNINPAEEMVDLMGSVRAYQLNASAVSASKQMIQESIDILKS